MEDQTVRSKGEHGVCDAKAQQTSNATTRYFNHLANAAGVAPGVVRAILDHIYRMALEDLRSRKVFFLRGIATFRHQLTAGRPARKKQLHGSIFKSKAIPERRKVYCRIIKELERAAVDPTQFTRLDAPVALACQASGKKKKMKKMKKPQAVSGLTSSEKFRRAVVDSINQSDITTDVVDRVITGLRAAMVRDLREKGIFVLHGLAGFYRVDAPARPMQYSNLRDQGQKLCKGSGPKKRVFCRVPWSQEHNYVPPIFFVS